MVKNLPSNAGDAGSIPGGGTKIPHAAEQLKPRALELWSPSTTARKKPARHNEKIPHATVKAPCAPPRCDAAKINK